MSYEIYLPQTFQKCIKLLKKKYPHIKEDLFPLFQNLQKDPQIGDAIPGWNRKIWKWSVLKSEFVWIWLPGLILVFLSRMLRFWIKD